VPPAYRSTAPVQQTSRVTEAACGPHRPPRSRQARRQHSSSSPDGRDDPPCHASVDRNEHADLRANPSIRALGLFNSSKRTGRGYRWYAVSGSHADDLGRDEHAALMRAPGLWDHEGGCTPRTLRGRARVVQRPAFNDAGRPSAPEDAPRPPLREPKPLAAASSRRPNGHCVRRLSHQRAAIALASKNPSSSSSMLLAA
jgi:hypothetical protein